MMSQDKIEINQINENIEVGISNLIEVPTSVIEHIEETINISIEGEDSVTINLEEFSENLIIEVTEPIEVTNIQVENIIEEVNVTITEEPYEEEVNISVFNTEESISINISENSFHVNSDFLATDGPSEILNLPSEFNPIQHSHSIEEVQGLTQELELKADLINGKVPASQLPIPQLGILEFPDFSSLPQPGSPGTLYITSDDDGQYRWKNGMYVSLFVLKDRTFVHEQGVPSNIWNIQHDLNKYPSVTIMDYYGNEYDGDITHVNINNIIIEFSLPFNGIATLN